MNLNIVLQFTHVIWVPVTTAWGVFELRMERGRPFRYSGGCEYIQYAVAHDQ